MSFVTHERAICLSKLCSPGMLPNSSKERDANITRHEQAAGPATVPRSLMQSAVCFSKPRYLSQQQKRKPQPRGEAARPKLFEPVPGPADPPTSGSMSKKSFGSFLLSFRPCKPADRDQRLVRHGYNPSSSCRAAGARKRFLGLMIVKQARRRPQRTSRLDRGWPSGAPSYAVSGLPCGQLTANLTA